MDLPSVGTYRFTVNADDGERLFVNGIKVLDAWSGSAGINTVDVAITNRCNVSLVLEYYEDTGQANLSLTWVKL